MPRVVVIHPLFANCLVLLCFRFVQPPDPRAPADRPASARPHPPPPLPPHPLRRAPPQPAHDPAAPPPPTPPPAPRPPGPALSPRRPRQYGGLPPPGPCHCHPQPHPGGPPHPRPVRSRPPDDALAGQRRGNVWGGSWHPWTAAGDYTQWYDPVQSEVSWWR